MLCLPSFPFSQEDLERRPSSLDKPNNVVHREFEIAKMELHESIFAAKKLNSILLSCKFAAKSQIWLYTHENQPSVSFYNFYLATRRHRSLNIHYIANTTKKDCCDDKRSQLPLRCVRSSINVN